MQNQPAERPLICAHSHTRPRMHMQYITEAPTQPAAGMYGPGCSGQPAAGTGQGRAGRRSSNSQARISLGISHDLMCTGHTRTYKVQRALQ